MAAFVKRYYVVGAIIVVVVSGAFALKAYLQSPERAVRSYVKSLAEQDWEAVYEMAPEGTLVTRSMSKKQFVDLMESVSEGISESAFTDTVIEPIDQPTQMEGRGEHYAFLTFPNAVLSDDSTLQILVRAMQSRDGWRIAPVELPIRVSQMHKGTEEEQFAVLLEAMREANLSVYPITFAGLVIERSRIERYIAGEIPKSELYTVRSK